MNEKLLCPLFRETDLSPQSARVYGRKKVALTNFDGACPYKEGVNVEHGLCPKSMNCDIYNKSSRTSGF